MYVSVRVGAMIQGTATCKTGGMCQPRVEWVARVLMSATCRMGWETRVLVLATCVGSSETAFNSSRVGGRWGCNCGGSWTEVRACAFAFSVRVCVHIYAFTYNVYALACVN